EVDVLAAGELGMKSCAELDERHDAAGDAHAPAGRPRDARDQLQQRRLAGAVRSDDAEAGTLGDVEADIFQREDRRRGPPADGAVDVALAAARPVERRRDDVDERARSPGAIALRHVLEANRDRAVSLYRQDRQRAAVRHETHEITKHT